MISEQIDINDNSDNEQNVNMFHGFYYFIFPLPHKNSQSTRMQTLRVSIFQSCNKLNRFIKIHKDILPKYSNTNVNSL